MSTEPQTPIWRRFMRRKRGFEKSSLIPLPKTPAEFPPNTPYPESLADQPTELMPTVTIVTESLQQPSPEALADEPTELMPVITIVTEPELQPLLELSTDEVTELMPVVTKMAKARLQPSIDPISTVAEPQLPSLPELSIEAPIEPIPAISTVAEPEQPSSPELSIEASIDPISTVAEPEQPSSPELSIETPIEPIPAVSTVAEPELLSAPELSTEVPIELIPAIAEPEQPSSPEAPVEPIPAISTAPEPQLQPSPKLLALAHWPLKRKQKQQKPHKKKLSVLFAFCCIITITATVFMSQGNGIAGAWMADTLRGLAGPTITAQVESWYLGLTNTASQMQYQLGNKQVNTPWKVATKVPLPTPTPLPTPPAWSTLSPMPLLSMAPLVSPALDGEGIWAVQDQAPAPYDYLPLDAKAFIRPDPSHPYAIVTLQQFDSRFTLLHIVGGTLEPGGPRGVHGPGAIPTNDMQGNALLAAFNGGFKYSDGRYGLMTDGVVYVPPQPDTATIAITKEGKLILGVWGVDPQLNSQNTDLVAWRQNGALLINQGVINPLTQDGAAWGGTILNSAYTWRSAIGITAQGTLLYAAGNALTADTLGQALKAAGAVMAMQTDINPFWVRAFLYNRDSNGQLAASKLNPQMQGTGYEYLYGNQRDFFYLTRFAPEVPPVSNQPPPLYGF